MRKYLVGTLFGFFLAFTLSVHADEIKSLVTEKYDAVTIQQNINQQHRILWAVGDAIANSQSSNSDTDIKRFTIYEQWKVTYKRAQDELAIWEARKAALTP